MPILHKILSSNRRYPLRIQFIAKDLALGLWLFKMHELLWLATLNILIGCLGILGLAKHNYITQLIFVLLNIATYSFMGTFYSMHEPRLFVGWMGLIDSVILIWLFLKLRYDRSLDTL